MLCGAHSNRCFRIFANVWSFRRTDGSDNILSSNTTEVAVLRGNGSTGWVEQASKKWATFL
jgi:hypothetical protein